MGDIVDDEDRNKNDVEELKELFCSIWHHCKVAMQDLKQPDVFILFLGYRHPLTGEDTSQGDLFLFLGCLGLELEDLVDDIIDARKDETIYSECEIYILYLIHDEEKDASQGKDP